MAKEAMEEASARGWASADGFVCRSCVDEDALRAAIGAQEIVEEECSFCDSSPAAPLDALLEAFVAGLRRLYDYARDELFWDGREGGYQGDTIDSWDVIGEFEHFLLGEGLPDAVRDALADELWVAKDWAVPAIEVLLTEGWDRFCDQVKYETRYVMWRKPADARRTPDQIEPARVLDAVGDLVDFYPEQLVAQLDPATPLWRARPHDAREDVSSAKELGTTPVKKSQSNRMSPAGIPMFYAALDADTAVAEATQSTTHKHVTVGAFHATAVGKLLDLTHLKPVPSIFAPDGDERGQWLFLHHFEKTLRAKPSHEAIDYVPTQIVTEYFLRIFGEGNFFDGVVYTSDVVEGQTCIVLDIRNEECLDPPAGPPGGPRLQVELDPVTISLRQV